ncbi:MAG TPA: hypothetical protein VFB98_02490 [Candidatus Deferrimicrobium sp.]|nr:hypothetical protein [Candidatus Deferrimicrobium sp.]
MEHNDREYTDMLNNELKDIEPGAGLHSKVRDGIARNVIHMRRRNTALGAVVIAVILTMGLSAVTPVFGRNGTLPQVITAMAAERQAKKISKTQGKSPVEQTGTALQTSVTTVKTVSDSALSETDGVLALVIANKSGTLVADVLKLRATGLGWGRIMAQLNVSGRDIGKAMSQVKAAAKTKGQGENPKPAVSNTDGNKIVVNGEITGVSTTLITVAAKTFVIAPTTQLKYQGKAITTTEIAAKLLTGKFYATVQGTKQVNTINTTTLLANVIIVQDTAEQANPSNEQANPSNEQANPSNEQAAVSNEQQKRGKVTVVTATVLHIDGFANDIILNADTKVEQVGAGTTNIAAIKLGQTVQVHVILSGTTYTAQQVHIEDAYVKTDTTANENQTTNSAVTTWQGTIAAIFPLNNSITVTTDANSLLVFRITATSVLQNTSHKALLFANLAVGQKVTITGTASTDNSVEVVKLTVTTSTSVNPGKGNGKH